MDQSRETFIRREDKQQLPISAKKCKGTKNKQSFNRKITKTKNSINFKLVNVVKCYLGFIIMFVFALESDQHGPGSIALLATIIDMKPISCLLSRKEIGNRAKR